MTATAAPRHGGRLLAAIPTGTVRFMYERMVLIRAFEERVKALMEAGTPFGVAHFYVGQEAVAVGVCAERGRTTWTGWRRSTRPRGR
ncbi:MAG TPA: hypothetical protein VH257_11025, partial [Chloroflexota bacterium]|nr:hypothetical protein [Chloroflexota bacterium]